MRPISKFECHIWDNCSGKDPDLLENFQLDVARIVCGACKGTSHNAVSEELGWESLKSRGLATKENHFAKICNKSYLSICVSCCQLRLVNIPKGL